MVDMKSKKRFIKRMDDLPRMVVHTGKKAKQ